MVVVVVVEADKKIKRTWDLAKRVCITTPSTKRAYLWWLVTYIVVTLEEIKLGKRKKYV